MTRIPLSAEDLPDGWIQLEAHGSAFAAVLPRPGRPAGIVAVAYAGSMEPGADRLYVVEQSWEEFRGRPARRTDLTRRSSAGEPVFTRRWEVPYSDWMLEVTLSCALEDYPMLGGQFDQFAAGLRLAA
ncbi:hypothetical protein ACQ3I4_12485 [Zafaria sp. Z1313]|uniref:hypothetical protein n=1 Tax=unclassified Zafaria TaxID=2828765 RepID=UPI002E767A68|nr:hypothetical protein [Zafaria sp. J156]MEE1620497.1 hypothetical protein [Zafaria sp. J156]